VTNDVSTGFYPNTNNFTCSASGRGPVIVPPSGTPVQGTNVGCIFIGRVMQFSVLGSGGEGFNIYTVAGQRLTGAVGSSEVTSLSQTMPVAIAQDSNNHSTVNAFDSGKLQSDLRVSKMTYTNSGTTTNIGAVGFFSTFGSYSGSNLVSGSQTINLIPIPGTALDMNSQSLADAVDSFAAGSYITNPTAGVTICFQSGSSNQYGQIIIGSNGRQTSTSKIIGTGNCP